MEKREFLYTVGGNENWSISNKWKTVHRYLKKLRVELLYVCVHVCVCVCVLVTQLCLTLCNLMDFSPLGSSVHGILQQEYQSG